MLTNGSLCQLHGAEAQESNGVQGDIDAVGIVRKGNEAVDAVREGGDLRLCDEIKVLAHNLLNGFKG